jgi:hypothetical protein
VTTGAQNAAETTKLVSIVRLFCSLFCSFTVSLALLFRAQSERDEGETKLRHPRGNGLEHHLSHSRSSSV